MTTAPLLEVKGLRAGYRRTTVLRGVDLLIETGSSVGLGGLNGAGKSTLLGALSDTVTHTAERLAVAGLPLRNGTHRRAAAGLAHVPEGRRVFVDLSVEENLTYGAVACGRSTGEARMTRRQVLDAFPPLRQLRDRRAGQLSGGEQQMLAIGRGLMAQPRLLMVDELCLGLSPRATEQICDGLRRVQDHHGTTLLLVDQNLALLADTCDEVYVLCDGVLSAATAPSEAAGMTYF